MKRKGVGPRKAGWETGSRERKLLERHNFTRYGESILLNEGGTSETDRRLLITAQRAVTRRQHMLERRRRPAGEPGRGRRSDATDLIAVEPTSGHLDGARRLAL
jgi:hypothetical protein